MTDEPVLHPSLSPLAGFLGVFEGDGRGHYPTIEPFSYREQLTFEHVGSPVIAYRQRTRSADGSRPMHAESGYLRIPGPDRVEWTMAHSFGIVELLEGVWDGAVLRMTSTALASSATAKVVGATHRELRLDGDGLISDVWMSYGGHEDVHHLESVLHRVR